jgi:hypothetical protein
MVISFGGSSGVGTGSWMAERRIDWTAPQSRGELVGRPHVGVRTVREASGLCLGNRARHPAVGSGVPPQRRFAKRCGKISEMRRELQSEYGFGSITTMPFL